MPKRTDIYNFLYLEDGDILYPGYDRENMFTAENQIFGMYDHLGEGVISGWLIYWLGCTSNPYVMQQRQALVDGYRTDSSSYFGLQYQLLDSPVTEAEWKQCIVVTTGLGIIDVFHAATENPYFFKLDTVDHFYVWAQKNACTNAEYLCEIVTPSYPDEDYDLLNSAIYIGEVLTNTVSGNVAVTQIMYSQRRRELKNAQGEIQRLLQQAVVNHVHSGENEMPSKINLSSRVVIIVPILEFSNTFIFEFPSEFNAENYNNIPSVYLDGVLLQPEQYQISGTVIYLQNSVSENSVLQIIYSLAPGPNISITSDYRQSPIGLTGNLGLSFNPQFGEYYLVDGTTAMQPNGSIYLNIFKWDDGDYADIQLFLNNNLIDSNAYILNNTQGTLKFIGPLFGSILDYIESSVSVRFIKPSYEITGLLSSDRIKSINAKSFTSGTMPSSRLSGLDHLGFFRIDESANLLPHKKLIDSGDHVNFYPEIDSYIQHSDYIYNITHTNILKANQSETITPPRTVLSTANGLFVTRLSPITYDNIVKLPWNTDIGLPNIFGDNYFDNLSVIKPSGISSSALSKINPRLFWVLSKTKNQYKNTLYLSTDFGYNFKKINIPRDSNNDLVTINDFWLTLDVTVVSVGNVILTPTINSKYIYYLATETGLYSANISSTQNPSKPIWQDASKNTTDHATGAINKISEALNVAINSATNSFGQTTTTYEIYRRLYAACDTGLFIYNNGTGKKFTTESVNYNIYGTPFNYVKWLGLDSGALNESDNVVWGDTSAIYFTLSAEKVTIQSNTNNGNSTSEIFVQPLSKLYTNYSASMASTENIDLSERILVIDGIDLYEGALILIKNQTTEEQNGVYIWTSSTQLLTNLNVQGPLKVIIESGVTQESTEWIELTSDNTTSIRKFALWFMKIIDLDAGGADYIVSSSKDKSSGPQSNVVGENYKNSFFIATTQFIYRVLVTIDAVNLVPQIVEIPWDVDKYGIITGIKHYELDSDPENGLLVVTTENGIYKSSPLVFSKDTLSYQRFINSISSVNSGQASVYDEYDLSEYTGKITSIGFATNYTLVSSGLYKNIPVFVGSTNGTGLTVDVDISNNTITSVEINNPGYNYDDNVNQGFVLVNGQKIYLQNIITQGYFVADSDSQAFVFSKDDGLIASQLVYEVEYKEFYIKPWSNYPLVIAKINNVISSKKFNYNSETGLIKFDISLSKIQKNFVTVSLSNKDQFIYNVGDAPHSEVFNITAAESKYTTTLIASYDPATSVNTILPISSFDNTKWNKDVKSIKVTGLRAATSGSTIQTSYTEIVQVTVDMSTERVFIRSKPTNLPLTSGSKIYIARIFSNILGIEDKITLYKTNLTYHLDSISHINVYKLYNSLLNVNSSMFTYNTYQNETLTGVDRGLKNSITIRSLSEFDSEATFIGYSFGVDPSSDDVAASPASINLILSFEYGQNPKFTTNKGIWEYNRSNSSWSKLDSIDNSDIIYFADKKLTNSLNEENYYSGTNNGLYYISDGVYTLNALFTEPMISLNMGEWFNANQQQRFEAYGKDSGLSFVLRTLNSDGTNLLQSDFFNGFVIYDIYYNTFFRFNEQGEKTEHPAIYLATDSSVWAFTTSVLSGSPGDRGANHYLLVGRQMFGSDAIKNPNLINPSLPGITAKIFKIVPLPPPDGSKQTWLAVCSSNGVYIVINWKTCDVGNPLGFTFVAQNNSIIYNKTIGRECYVLIQKSNTNTWFTGTNNGVLKSIDRCYSWNPVSSFGGQELSVNDLKYFTNGNSGYLIATTNLGIWTSADDGDTWEEISVVSDSNIKINLQPTSGRPLSQVPEQTFSSITSGTVKKAFVYFDPRNLITDTTIYAKIKIGSLTTQSSSSISLNSLSYPGMYGFTFSTAPILANITYTLGLTTDSNSSNATMGLSTLDDPYENGSARTSIGTILDKDFYFRIDLNASAQPTETIIPVGFYNTGYAIGFGSGKYLGASISSSGYLYSNVGIICNILIDTSKSFELNDQAILTQGSSSTAYVKQAIIDSIVPNGVSTNNLYTRLLNGYGTSKILMSLYGFNNTINDLLFFSTNQNSVADTCFSSSSSGILSGYTNTPTLLQNAISYVTNNGRLSKLYDAMLYNSRLQFPAIVNYFYKNNLTLIDRDFINILFVKEQYKSLPTQYVSLKLELVSGSNYRIYLDGSDNNFIWTSGIYSYALVKYTNGTCDIVSSPDTYISGIYVNSSSSTPEFFILSKDWAFDSAICDLSSSYSDYVTSSQALDFVLDQYANSFKPFIVVATDGNDNSKATSEDVKNSLSVGWKGDGNQVLIVEPSYSGNQNIIRQAIEDTNSKIFNYSSYPDSDLRSIIYENDDLKLLTSYWTREFDYDDPTFISFIYTDFVTPGDSTASIKFKWSANRIDFSEYIDLYSTQRHYLNQKVLAIYYKVDFEESYSNSFRDLPYVKQLYHVEVTPAIQNYVTNEQSISGQLFETLVSASFTNNESAHIVPLVGRTRSTDLTYYESIQLGRNGCLSNRQTSYRITAPYTQTSLRLFPSSVDDSGNYNYFQFYVINESGNIIEWTINDIFTLYIAEGIEVSKSGYITIPESGIIAFNEPQNTQLLDGTLQYELYFAKIQYAEKKESIIGEPTTTNDYKTYYFRNGRVPTDATIVILINQKIYRGTYSLSYYDGTVTFAKSLSSDDYVTVFIKFADYFRIGLQIESYSVSNLSLQSFNFVYTTLSDLPTYQESFNYTKPYLSSGLSILPLQPKINDLMFLNYQYKDDNLTPEHGSIIQWWRKRTGIEYVTFNPTHNLKVINNSGVTISGINTFTVNSLYNQSENPFILSVTVNFVGLGTKITKISILDRGSNFIGTSVNVVGIVTQNGVTLSSLGIAITAYQLTPSYQPGYATTDYFARIHPNTNIGYATVNIGFATTAVITSFPNYDFKTIERSVDIGARTLFDARDQIYATIAPCNGFSTGKTYKSNTVTMFKGYKPSVSNLSILNAQSRYDGISTSYIVNSLENQVGIYSYLSGINTTGYINQQSSALNNNVIKWFKFKESGNELISILGILSSSLIIPGNQIFFSLYPGVLNEDGSIGYGNTTYSDTYIVG